MSLTTFFQQRHNVSNNYTSINQLFTNKSIQNLTIYDKITLYN